MEAIENSTEEQSCQSQTVLNENKKMLHDTPASETEASGIDFTTVHATAEVKAGKPLVEKGDIEPDATDKMGMDSMFTRCKQLALNKEFHTALISDRIFCPFLVLCLDSNTENDVLRALEVFHLLAVNADSTYGLAKVLHLFDGLKAAASNVKLSKEVRDFAILVYGIVKNSRQHPLKAQSENKLNKQPPVQRKIAVAKRAENSLASGRGHGKHESSFCKGRGIDLYVPQCIFKERRLRMTEALLTLNGIISITYDMKKCYCLIRAKPSIPVELFGKAIANLGFECHLVTKGENEEVTLTLMQPDPKLGNNMSTYEKENIGGRKSPQYLSDSDLETSLQEPQAVTTADSKGKEKKGWLTSATDFFQKSFYW